MKEEKEIMFSGGPYMLSSICHFQTAIIQIKEDGGNNEMTHAAYQRTWVKYLPKTRKKAVDWTPTFSDPR